MNKCIACQDEYKPIKGTFTFKRKSGLCSSCMTKIIEGLFSQGLFNEWLDSFLQSRIEKYLPDYKEYYEIYHKKKCPECNGKGIIGEGTVCRRCGFIGVIDA